MIMEILLKDIQKNQNITLRELSKRTGVLISHINDIENNYKMPSLLISVIIAKKLKIHISDLYKIYY